MSSLPKSFGTLAREIMPVVGVIGTWAYQKYEPLLGNGVRISPELSDRVRHGASYSFAEILLLDLMQLGVLHCPGYSDPYVSVRTPLCPAVWVPDGWHGFPRILESALCLYRVSAAHHADPTRALRFAVQDTVEALRLERLGA